MYGLLFSPGNFLIVSYSFFMSLPLPLPLEDHQWNYVCPRWCCSCPFNNSHCVLASAVFVLLFLFCCVLFCCFCSADRLKPCSLYFHGSCVVIQWNLFLFPFPRYTKGFIACGFQSIVHSLPHILYVRIFSL